MKLETLQTIIKTFECASDDAVRYMLQFVEVERIDDKSVAIRACDEHKLAQSIVEDSELAANLESCTKAYCDPDYLPALKALAKQRKGFDDLGACRWIDQPGPYGTTKVLCLGHITGSITLLRQERRDFYPDTKPLWPKHAEFTEITFNPRYVMELWKSLNGDKRNESITLRIKGKLDPILVMSNNNTGILMPRKA